MSLLAGCWWAAPVPRVEMAHRVFLRPECGACGRTSECLPLHLLAGQCPGEAPCPCVEASRCRAEWEAEVGRLYAQYADAEATVAFALAAPRTLQRAALMLGWARGVELPWELSCALPPGKQKGEGITLHPYETADGYGRRVRPSGEGYG